MTGPASTDADEEAVAEKILARLIAGESAEDILRDFPPEASGTKKAAVEAALSSSRDTSARAKVTGQTSTVVAPTVQKPGNAFAVRTGKKPD